MKKDKGTFNLFASLREEAQAKLTDLRAQLAQKSRDDYEESMLKVAEEFLAAKSWSRARGILEIHANRFPNSCVKAMRNEWLAFIPQQIKLEKEAERLRVKINGATFTGKELKTLEAEMLAPR